MNKVFVYGILRKGKDNATLPNHLRFFRNHATIMISDGNNVRGELQEVTDDELSRYDMIEGTPSYYVRVTKDIITDDNKIVKAYVYQQREDYENDL